METDVVVMLLSLMIGAYYILLAGTQYSARGCHIRCDLRFFYIGRNSRHRAVGFRHHLMKLRGEVGVRLNRRSVSCGVNLFNLFAMNYSHRKLHKTSRVTPAMEASIAERMCTMEDVTGLLTEKELPSYVWIMFKTSNNFMVPLSITTSS